MAAERAKLTAYAELHDLELIAVVVDAGVSAKTLDRPGLTRALGMLGTTADALLVVKLDRLTRSVRDLGTLVEDHFAEGSAALLSVGEHIDTRSAAGRLVLNVLASVSQWEREAIGERTSAVMRHKASRGEHTGGAPPYGWTVAPDGVQLGDPCRGAGDDRARSCARRERPLADRDDKGHHVARPQSDRLHVDGHRRRRPREDPAGPDTSATTRPSGTSERRRTCARGLATSSLPYRRSSSIQEKGCHPCGGHPLSLPRPGQGSWTAARNYSKCWRGGRDSNPNEMPTIKALRETTDETVSRDAQKTGAEASPIADQNRNDSDAALRAAIAAAIITGDDARASALLDILKATPRPATVLRLAGKPERQ